MLSVNVTLIGDRVVINGLSQLAAEMPRVVQRGLRKVVKGVHREAMANLNGAGGFNLYENRTSRSGRQYRKKVGSKVSYYVGFTRSNGSVQMFKRFTDSGGYPVPVRTGNLKRLLDFVNPGQSKESGSFSFSAGNMESIIFDSAEYASVIHDGRGSSAKFGPRPFLTDALNKFNQGGYMEALFENEIRDEVVMRGLA